MITPPDSLLYEAIRWGVISFIVLRAVLSIATAIVMQVYFFICSILQCNVHFRIASGELVTVSKHYSENIEEGIGGAAAFVMFFHQLSSQNRLAEIR